MTVDNSWIKPGVEVVAYRHDGGRSDNPTVMKTTVRTVAAKSFTLVDLDERIKLDSLRTKTLGGTWNLYWWEVIHPGSEQARQLFDRKRLAALEMKAFTAVKHWNTGSGRRNPNLLGEAIEALAALLFGIQEASDG